MSDYMTKDDTGIELRWTNELIGQQAVVGTKEKSTICPFTYFLVQYLLYQEVSINFRRGQNAVKKLLFCKF